ncbi:hypothetical protein SNL152K_5854 [Streptomyces sp. NL15-2K]|nr:hypothetical protein SNL152K_5854 [Streptomyces sp. NL15-2K]
MAGDERRRHGSLRARFVRFTRPAIAGGREDGAPFHRRIRCDPCMVKAHSDRTTSA